MQPTVSGGFHGCCYRILQSAKRGCDSSGRGRPGTALMGRGTPGQRGRVKAAFTALSPRHGPPPRKASERQHWMETCLLHLAAASPTGSSSSPSAQDQVLPTEGADSHVQPRSAPKECPHSSFISERAWALICSSPTFNQTIYSRSTFRWELKAIL